MNIDLVLDILHGLLFRGGNPTSGIRNVPVGLVTASGICFEPEAWRLPGNYPGGDPQVGEQCFVWCQVQPHLVTPHLKVKLNNVGVVAPLALRDAFHAAVNPAGPLTLQGPAQVNAGHWPVYYAVALGPGQAAFASEAEYAMALHKAIVQVLNGADFVLVSNAVVALLQPNQP